MEIFHRGNLVCITYVTHLYIKSWRSDESIRTNPSFLYFGVLLMLLLPLSHFRKCDIDNFRISVRQELFELEWDENRDEITPVLMFWLYYCLRCRTSPDSWYLKYHDAAAAALRRTKFSMSYLAARIFTIRSKKHVVGGKVTLVPV